MTMRDFIFFFLKGSQRKTGLLCKFIKINNLNQDLLVYLEGIVDVVDITCLNLRDVNQACGTIFQ